MSGVSTAITLLKTRGGGEPPVITMAQSVYDSYTEYSQNSYGEIPTPITANLNVGFTVTGGVPTTITAERLGGRVLVIGTVTSSNAPMSLSTDSTSTQSFTSTYRIAATIDGVTYYSSNFTVNFVFYYKIKVTTESSSYPAACTYTSPAVSCGKLIQVKYNFTGKTAAGSGINASLLAMNVEWVSGVVPNQTAGSLGNFIYITLSSSTTGTVSGVVRLKADYSGGTVYSPNISWSLATSSTPPPVPTINTSGATTGTCDYYYPATSCTATGVRNFSISNYSTGTPFAELVSGTSLTAIFSGSNSSGSFTFSRANTTSGGPTTSVYRIGINVASNNYYSSNFSMDMSSSYTGYNLGSGLIYNKDCNDSGSSPSVLSQGGTTTTYVSGKVGTCVRDVYPNASGGNFIYRTVGNLTTAGAPFTFSIWFRCSQPFTNTGTDYIRLLVGNIFYNSASQLGLNISSLYNYLTSWNNICCWYDGTTLYTSLNGGTSSSSGNTAYGTASVGGSFALNSTNYIGYQGRASGSTDVFMEIDSVFIWNRILNAGERNVLYNNGTGRAGTALAGLVG